MGELETVNKSIVERFGEAMNSRRSELFDDLLTPDFVRHCQATPGLDIRDREAFKRFMEADWAGVPDGRIKSRMMVAEGDRVAFWNTYIGTQTGPWGPLPPSHKPFQFDFGGVARLTGGRIAELWVTWDNLVILSQLGYWPPKTP